LIVVVVFNATFVPFVSS